MITLCCNFEGRPQSLTHNLLMEPIYQSFVNLLVHQTLGLQAAYEEAFEYWRPDEPPVTTLFAALGDRIADDFESTELDVNSRIFALIESAMASGDQKLITAVATGLIEAMISRVTAKEGSSRRLTQELGALSRKHAEAWMA